MDSFAHALRQLQSGALQHPEFLAQLDRVLESAPESPGRLLELLSEEHARAPLPGELYKEVQLRIGRLIAARQRLGGDDTFVQTRPGAHAAPQASPPAPRIEDELANEPERMKGVGETLNGRFVLEECIGFGGMGTVYKALDLRKLEASDRNPYIAIKVLNVQFRGHPKSLIALQREARKAQALAHPNIVSVYDFDRDGPMVYLTMEYLPGKPLSQVLRAPGFAGMLYAQVLPIVNGMGNALAYAHGRGFVHCDFKPGNVIVTAGGAVKVIDFGIARVFQKTEADVDVTVFDPGSLGALTPAYASPEMLEQREPDPRDDIYALACITYELLTGRHPFNRLSSAQARGAGMKPQRPPGLGRSQWQALRCALALEREARTQTVARFLADFGASGTKTRGKLVAVSSAAAVALAALAVGGWYLFGRSPAAPAAATATAPAAEAEPAPVAAATAPPTPEALAAALAGIPCAALLASAGADSVQVQGVVSAAIGEAGVRAPLQALPGVAKIELAVREVDPALCPVVTAFAPYWLAHRQAGGGAALRLAGATEAGLSEGDSLMVAVTTPNAASFMTVDAYLPPAGVIHLLPNALALDNRAPPRHSVTIGRPGDWQIGKPAGAGLVVVLVTTPEPLFGTLRRETEATPDYLAGVAASLEQIRARSSAGAIGVEFLPVATRARE
ncbi:serine/threonine-protein kinase [Massilia sp. Leaf139]|uniref:serine/threonine-protein kinase n=1 Tax=Massilia sp. Leaf139 TaxID=1736272 RepID=UPI0006FFB4CD|nr:serine/threonine-protein kinase [Massilia sp. Leaf139]KQQ97192.1 protein kinase [Massilia sp. Leaf139]